VRGSTLGIVGFYGLAAKWHGARRRLAAVSLSPIARKRASGVENVFPLAEIDRMLPECDTLALCTGLGPGPPG
jgi:phosphoglycerate dehydrogenase-like enzyme